MRVALLFIFALALQAADVVTDERKIDWTYAGIPGGIPNRTTIYTTYTASATSAQIQGGINSCPSNQVVKLSAGTYTLTTSLTCARDGVTIRGATNSQGVPTAILNFDANSGGYGLVDFAKELYPDNAWASSVASVNVSSGLTKGSTQVVLASALSGLAVGEVLTFDQTADESLTHGAGSQGGGGGDRPTDRVYRQGVIVTAINGTTIDFTPPISGHYWNASQDPEAWRYVGGINDVTFMSGLEDVWVVRENGGDGTHNVHAGPAARCWYKNVYSTQCASSHFRFAFTVQCEVRDCFAMVHDDVGSATYSVWLHATSSARVENNIMTNTPCAIGVVISDSNFLGYNAATNFPYSTPTNHLPECVMVGHGSHVYANLFEGNYVSSVWADWIHGSGSHNTFVRNRVPGWEQYKTQNTRAINFQENNDTNTVVGNVLGTDSYHTAYSGEPFGIYSINVDVDEPSLVRKANYNTVDDGIHSSSPDETLGSDTMQDSYVYSGAERPEHWGDRPWPPYDYESPTTSLTGAGYTNNAAGYRLFFGEWPAAAEGGGGTATITTGVKLGTGIKVQ